MFLGKASYIHDLIFTGSPFSGKVPLVPVAPTSLSCDAQLTTTMEESTGSASMNRLKSLFFPEREIRELVDAEIIENNKSIED